MINTPKTQRTAIFIPSYNRPHVLSRVLGNIFDTTPHELFQIYLILEPHDTVSVDAAVFLTRAKVILNKGKGCYADAINTAYNETAEPYFFTGADDLNFHKNWLQEALAIMKKPIGVVGTNDMGTIPIGEKRNSTHYLVSRDYIKTQGGCIDTPNIVLYPYDHNYTDTEFTQTAISRGVYAYAPDSLVEHMHPAWQKSGWDETYKRGQMSEGRDRNLFIQRKHLWGQ